MNKHKVKRHQNSDTRQQRTTTKLPPGKTPGKDHNN